MSARFPYLFIITYGRSGSTLLQGVLNSIPQYCIRGENNGVLQYLRLTHQQTSAANKNFSAIAKTPADAWYGIDGVDTDELLDDLRSFFIKHYIRPPEGTRCMGFKEIRYAPKMVGRLGQYVRFMELIFPGAGFIFNARDIETTAASDFWRARKDAIPFLTAFKKRMENAHNTCRHKENSYWINYEDYVKNPEGLKGLFEFLDEPYDQKRIKQVLATPHSAQPRGSGKKPTAKR